MGMQVRGVFALVAMRAFPWVWELVAVGLVVMGVVGGVEVGRGAAVISVLGGYLGYTVVRATVAAGRAGAEPSVGRSVALPREAHPRLWAELDEVTAGLRREPVGYALADGSPGTRVTGRGAGLTIGLPLLAALDRAGLRAVLAHALVEGGGRSLPARVARADAWLGAVHEHSRSTPFAGVFGAYHRACHALAAPALRANARAVRQRATRVAGPAADLAAVEGGWALLHERYLPLADPAHAPSALEGLLGVLEADGWTGGSRGTPAAQLLGRGGTSLDELEVALHLRGADPATWDDVVTAVATDRARERTAVLLGALAQLGRAAEPSVGTLLRAVVAGVGPNLARALLPADLSPAEAEGAWRDALLQHLDSAVFTLLAGAGRARVRVDWERRWRVEVPGAGRRAGPWPFETPLRAVIGGDPAAAPWVADAVRALGADPEQSLEVGPADVRSTLRGGAGPVLQRPAPGGRRRRADVLVYDDGLLVVPSPRRRRGLTAAASVATAGFRNVTRLAETVGTRPGAWAEGQSREVQWIPVEHVSSSSGWRGRLGERRWELALGRSAKVSFTTTGETGWIGSPDQLTGAVTRAMSGVALTSGRGGGGAGRRGRRTTSGS